MAEFDFLNQFAFQQSGGITNLATGDPYYTGTGNQQEQQFRADQAAGTLPAVPLWRVPKTYQFGNVGTGNLYARFGQAALEGPIQDIYDARVGQAVEGNYGAFMEAMRSNQASARAAGVPDYIARERTNAMRAQYEADAAAGVYGAAAERAENTFNLQALVTSKIAEATYFQAGIDLQKYAIKKGQKQADRAFEQSLIQSGISFAGSIATAGILR